MKRQIIYILIMAAIIMAFFILLPGHCRSQGLKTNSELNELEKFAVAAIWTDVLQKIFPDQNIISTFGIFPKNHKMWFYVECSIKPESNSDFSGLLFLDKNTQKFVMFKAWYELKIKKWEVIDNWNEKGELTSLGIIPMEVIVTKLSPKNKRR